MAPRIAVSLCAAVVTLSFAGAASAARLAYVTGTAKTKVWLAAGDGTAARELGPGDTALLSPNGAAVASSLLGQSKAGLAVYRPGAATRTYFRNRLASASADSWSPDSRYLAVALTSNKPSGRGSALDVIDTSSGSVKTIARGSICGASFAPHGPDRLAYARAPGSFECFNGRVNVFTANADGTASRQITRDGASANPLWGPRSIVFDHVTLRPHFAPAYQLWTMRPDGSHRIQITHVKTSQLVDGLAPVSLSADGKRLLAAYEGQDTNEAWTVVIPTHRVHRLRVGGRAVSAAAISRSGSSLLVAADFPDSPPSKGTVESVAFGGGPAKVLVRHAAEPSWNR